MQFSLTSILSKSVHCIGNFISCPPTSLSINLSFALSLSTSNPHECHGSRRIRSTIQHGFTASSSSCVSISGRSIGDYTHFFSPPPPSPTPSSLPPSLLLRLTLITRTSSIRPDRHPSGRFLQGWTGLGTMGRAVVVL